MTSAIKCLAPVQLQTYFLSLILLVGVLAACQADPTPTPGVPTLDSSNQEQSEDTTEDEPAALGEPFTLGLGQRATIEGTELALTFEEVERDGRCPSAVLCSENGPVIVIISAALGDEQLTTFTMNPDPQLAQLSGMPPNMMEYQGFEIELTAVEPYPEQPEDLMNLPYTATLIVRQVAAS